MLAARGAQGVEQKDREILDKDREYQQQIAMLRKQITILADLGTRAPHGEKETAEKTLAATEEKYEQFINEVKLQNTELASLVTVEVTPVDKIQAALDPSTTVVEYFTTKDTTYVWLISRDAVTVHEIKAGEKALEVAVNNLLLPTISSSSRRPWGSVLAGGEQKSIVSESDLELNRKNFLKTTQDFYQLIFQPVEGDIHTSKLIIVPHGTLHKVPFAALNDGKSFLVDKYTISIDPSSSVIDYVIKKEEAQPGQAARPVEPEDGLPTAGVCRGGGEEHLPALQKEGGLLGGRCYRDKGKGKVILCRHHPLCLPWGVQ